MDPGNTGKPPEPLAKDSSTLEHSALVEKIKAELKECKIMIHNAQTSTGGIFSPDWYRYLTYRIKILEHQLSAGTTGEDSKDEYEGIVAKAFPHDFYPNIYDKAWNKDTSGLSPVNKIETEKDELYLIDLEQNAILEALFTDMFSYVKNKYTKLKDEKEKARLLPEILILQALLGGEKKYWKIEEKSKQNHFGIMTVLYPFEERKEALTKKRKELAKKNPKEKPKELEALWQDELKTFWEEEFKTTWDKLKAIEVSFDKQG